MFSFKDFLSEGFSILQSHHEDEKNDHAEHVFNMVQNAYSSIGGIHGSGFKDHKDMVKNIPIWKLHKDHTGKVRAVGLYKVKNGKDRKSVV
jgi:hypothetical protein